MRLSLLLPREPFPVIFEQTLSRFLLSWTGRPYEIHWRPKRPLSASPYRSGEFWLVNNYLNAIFIPQADPAIFGPGQAGIFPQPGPVAPLAAAVLC